MQSIDQKKIFGCLLILSIFSLPLSVSLRSIFLGLATTGFFLSPALYTDFKKFFRQPWCKALLLFLLIIMTSALFGESAWKVKFSMAHKYLKLLYIPLIAIYFQQTDILKKAVHAFLFAMLVTFMASLYFICFSASPSLVEVDGIFQNHILTGYYMAFAAFFSVIYARESRGKLRMLYCLLCLLFSFYTLYINTGRTGYETYSVLFLLFFVHSVPLRKLPLTLCLALSILSIFAWNSPSFKTGVRNIMQNARDFNAGNKNTSIGYRIQFHQYAKQLFISSPLWGLGTGEFAARFHKDNPVPQWGDHLLEPHSQYWLTATENGMAGLSALILFFLGLFLHIYKTSENRLILTGLLCTFMLVLFSDSFLILSPGYFLVLFTGICLAKQVHLEKACPDSDPLWETDSNEKVLPLSMTKAKPV